MKRLIITITMLLFIMPFTAVASVTPLYQNAINETSIPKGSLNQAKAAIASGSLNVAFIGDSITEGGDQTDPNDAYWMKITSALTEQLPGVNVNSFNFAIGGTGLRSSVDSTFTCTSTATSILGYTTNTFSRPWCVVGQPWLAPVKNYSPDLVIVAFGMNDSGAGEHLTADNLKILTDTLKGWQKSPSVVLVSNMMPTNNPTIWTGDPQGPLKVARATREFAHQNHYALADVNRLWQILRDGLDDVERVSNAEFNFEGYTTNWSGSTSNFTLSGNTLTPISGTAGKWVTRGRPFYNGAIEFDVTPVADGWNGALWLIYRDYSNYGTHRMIFVPGTNGSINLYESDENTPYSSSVYTSVYSSTTHIRLEVNGIHHKVYVNGKKLIDTITYKRLQNGSISFGNGSGLNPIISNVTITYSDPLKTDPVYTVDDLAGLYNSKQSGNGFNHPSGLGHTVGYFSSFTKIIDELTR